MAEINSTTGHEGEVIDVQGLKASLQKLKTTHIDTKANTSSLGTAATKNVPTSGNATTTQVVMGNDSRLSDSRNASDVSAWAKAENKPTYTALEVGAIPTNEKGAANGVASLDNSGKVPQSQLPSYVDDVLEYDTKPAFPATGESGKIYVNKADNTSWRWSGTQYVQIKGDLALGETSTTAYRGDRGKIAYDHSQSTHARTDATKTEASTTNGNIKINGTETTVYTHPTTTATEAAAVKVGKDAQGHVVIGDALPIEYSDVYIGVAAASSTIAVSQYHHNTIVKNSPIAFSNVSGYLWVILPENYSPVATMSNIEIPMSLDSTTTIEEKVYKVWKSANSYSGSFNIYLL